MDGCHGDDMTCDMKQSLSSDHSLCLANSYDFMSCLDYNCKGLGKEILELLLITCMGRKALKFNTMANY